MTCAEIIQIVIGVLTLIATGFVPVMIYWLQKRHEKEIDALNKEREAGVLSEKANEFLIDNESERDYLPWCTIATALHRQEHHTRKIYTEFCRCPVELQLEILKQAGFTIALIQNDGWVERSIECIREFIKENKLGRDWLYDNAKYFHRGFERYRDQVWEMTPHIFKPISVDSGDRIRSLFGNHDVNIGYYIDDYLWAQGHNNQNEDLLAPIDYVEQTQHLGTCEEDEVCRWIMDIVYYVTKYIHNTTKPSNNLWYENRTDAEPETYEDRYYETLFVMYNTFDGKK